MKSLKQPSVTDKEIAHIQTMREMTKVLKARLEKLENELEANEQQLSHYLRLELKITAHLMSQSANHLEDIQSIKKKSRSA